MVAVKFVSVVEMTAGYQNVVNNYLPKQLYLNTGITLCLMVGLVIVIIGSGRKWYQVGIKAQPHHSAYTHAAIAGQD